MSFGSVADSQAMIGELARTNPWMPARLLSSRWISGHGRSFSRCSRANVTNRMEFAEATPTLMIAPIRDGMENVSLTFLLCGPCSMPQIRGTVLR